MARKPKSPTEEPTAEADVVAIQNATEAFDEHNRRVAIIDEQYGAGLPYDRTRLENETRFHLNVASDSMLEAGKRLIVIKEHEPHGAFLESLERIGLPPRGAQRLMQASVKFGSGSRTKLAGLGKAKMLELMTEDDDALEELADGGTIAGVTLDEVERMTSRELRAALRKAREDAKQEAEVHEKLLAKKDEKINELDRQLSRPRPADETSDEQAKALTADTQLVLGHLLALEQTIIAVHKRGDEAPVDLRDACAQAILRIKTRIDEIETDNQLLVVGVPDDSWIEEARQIRPEKKIN